MATAGFGVTYFPAPTRETLARKRRLRRAQSREQGQLLANAILLNVAALTREGGTVAATAVRDSRTASRIPV